MFVQVSGPFCCSGVDLVGLSIVVWMKIDKGWKENLRSRSWFVFDQGPCGVALTTLLRQPRSSGVIRRWPVLERVLLTSVGGGCACLAAAWAG
jgi:hypothetical protein